MSDEEIATHLSLSIRTVLGYKQRMADILELNDPSDLTRIALFWVQYKEV
jgi:DNA-binding CsgD family transcriptional regulator